MYTFDHTQISDRSLCKKGRMVIGFFRLCLLKTREYFSSILEKLSISFLSELDISCNMRHLDYVLKGRHTFYGNVNVYIYKVILKFLIRRHILAIYKSLDHSTKNFSIYLSISIVSSKRVGRQSGTDDNTSLKNLKLLKANFYFSPNDSLSKTMKNVFYFI